MNFLTKEVGHRRRPGLHGRLPHHVHGLRALPREAAARAASTSTSSSSTRQTTDEVTPASLGLTQAVPQAGGDPLAAEPVHAGEGPGRDRPGDDRRGRDDGQGDAAGRRRGRRTPDLDTYDQQLMTAVVERAEKAGKEVKPLIVPTNNPLHAVLQHGQGPAGPGTDHGRVATSTRPTSSWSRSPSTGSACTTATRRR